MIDKNPQVGRYLLKETIWVHGFCYRGGMITKISGKRIYFNNEYGSPGFESTEEAYVTKFAAICDTREEFEMLKDHSKKCMEEHKELTQRQEQEWRNFFKPKE